MAECIDREAAIEAAKHAWAKGLEPSQYIDNIPAADVAQVVRCQDCKHAWIHPCGYVYCHRDGRNAYEMTFDLDSFCSYGERKAGDE